MIDNGFVYASWQTARDGFDDFMAAHNGGDAAKGAVFALGGATCAGVGAALSGVRKLAGTALRGAQVGVNTLVDHAVDSGRLESKYGTPLKVIGGGVLGLAATLLVASEVSNAISDD